MVVKFNSEVFDCSKAVRDGNSATLFLTDGGVVSLDGVSNWSAYTIEGGTWTEALPITAAEQARAQRDALLVASDWTQTLDAPIDPASRDAYRDYRQQLRDVPQQEGFPGSIQWPQEPAATKALPDPVDRAVDELLGGGQA